MSSKDIEHKGKVVSITPEVTTVKIVSESACSACHAKSLCSASESTVKEIQVPTESTLLCVGDEVTVTMSATMGHKAVAFAYVLPLVVMMVSIAVFTLCGAGELLSGLGTVGAVVCYYIVLCFLRSSLQDSYEFKIKK